jgi:hypothetical protein
MIEAGGARQAARARLAGHRQQCRCAVGAQRDGVARAPKHFEADHVAVEALGALEIIDSQRDRANARRGMDRERCHTYLALFAGVRSCMLPRNASLYRRTGSEPVLSQQANDWMPRYTIKAAIACGSKIFSVLSLLVFALRAKTSNNIDRAKV